MQRIKGFDGIRGLAALAVVLTHLNVWGILQRSGVMSAALVPLVHGMAAVQAFFVLSGFLITTLLITEHNTTGSIAIGHFFIRRALRIFPLYYALLLVCITLYSLDNRITSPTSLAYASGYVYNFIPKRLYTSFLGHTWSLAVEEHFYLLWPLAFPWLYRRHQIGMVILLGLITVCLLIHYCLFTSKAYNGYFIERWTFTAGYAILAGCTLAWVLQANSPLIAKQWLNASVVAVLGLAFYLAPATVYGLSPVFDGVFSHAMRCVGLVCGIGWLVCRQSSRVVMALEWSPLRYLGTISYGIYMYQGLFLATGPLRKAGHLWPPPQPVGLCLLVLVAPLSYHFFEQPLTQLKHKLQR
jgi:peptidoglycan/LPS O-acetylase OafA/YrhL